MAKVLTDLPAGFSLAPTKTSVTQETPSGAPKATSASPSRQSQGRAPKALERVGSKSTMNDHSDWMIRRCDAFGIASSRYFKKNHTCPKPTGKNA